jgi:hypothetical protein
MIVAFVGIARSAHAQCTSERDCRDGRVCREGSCVYAEYASCEVDVDCPEGYLCESGQCAPMSKATPPPPAPDKPEPEPEPEYETVTTGLVLPMTGLGIFGGTWLATIITAAATKPDYIDGSAIGLAAIPGAGPALLADKYDFDELGMAGLVTSVTLQTVGLGLFVYGVYGIGSKRVRVDEGRLELVPAPGGLGLRWTTSAL